MKKLQTVRGTKDILEEEHRQIVFITNYWQYITSAYGFNMIQTPIIEDSEVFKKTLGMTSDIIKKETYTFKDRSENEITLRPEGTASIVRFFINNKLINDLGIEWLNSLRNMLITQKKLKNFKLYVDVKNNYGLFISLVEKGIDYIKIETSKENISKIKEIAKLNKVLINPQFSVVDPLNSKI